jgi:hypothetical protein
MQRNFSLTTTAIVAIGLMLMLAVCGQLEQQAPVAKGGKKKIGDVLKFVHLEEKGFPLNINPEIIAANEADIDDGDMVMGIVINGEARAYPVNYMGGPTNEVVNDRLGGQAIAPSW